MDPGGPRRRRRRVAPEHQLDRARSLRAEPRARPDLRPRLPARDRRDLPPRKGEVTMPRLPAFVDERFLNHRLRSTSAGGLAGVVLALGLYLFHIFHDHRLDWELFAVGVIAVIVKYAVFFWLRTHD